MSTATSKPPYELVDFASIAPVACPCGQARRGLAEVQDFPGTIHVTEISVNATLHYHKRLTETYYFLECGAGAQMQLNDEILDVRPGTCIMIRPGTRHRALGNMKVLIVVYPKFDPADEWFD
jgi:mannose-6-phosphate isomerase-like protein (cupin superfamily)